MNGAKDYTVPLGSIMQGRLQFTRGAANVTLRVDSSMGDLYRARFDGPPPEVYAQDGAVTIRYPRTFHPFDWRKRAAEVTLNPAIPWQIEFHSGLSRLDADLSVLELGSFEVTGGASGVAGDPPSPFGHRFGSRLRWRQRREHPPPRRRRRADQRGSRRQQARIRRAALRRRRR